MVLFKRKPVKPAPLPKIIDDNTEVWAIEETGEIFTDYEKYLDRYDFYNQRSFTCESTGHSSFTYFEAKESEVGYTSVLGNGNDEVTTAQTEASNEVNSIFPDALRSQVLRFVQFQTWTRMDELVNNVFDVFREHFTVGDRVSVEVNNARRYGNITEMTDTSHMHTLFSGDDSVRSYTYVITLDDTKEQITKYKPSELQRDKKVYSKLILKQFLRGALKREAWIGAPWMVKDSLAKRYDISTKVPDHKTRNAILAQKKALNNVLPNGNPPARSYQQHAPNGHMTHANGHRQAQQGPGQVLPAFVNFSANAPHAYAHPGVVQPPFPTLNGPPRPYLVNLPPIFNSGPPPQIHVPYPNHFAQLPQHHPLAHLLPPPGSVQPMNYPFQTSFNHQQDNRPAHPSQPQQSPQLARPFEPVKYPCEDLEIKQPRVVVNRPTLKFFSDDVPEGCQSPDNSKKTGVLMKSMGALLCAWETLNVHDTIYTLDSFTFDDFVDAMRFSSDEVDCELFVEVHCSILKQIISDSGKILSPLPNMAETEDSEDESSSKESTPEPEPEPPVRTTRSSLRKSGIQQLTAVKERTPTPEPPKDIHKAAEFVSEFDWVEYCKVRNFREGGWQSIVVALLYRLSFDPVQKDACDEILAHLVPAEEEEPSMENIENNYNTLDVNLRISALDIILKLTVVTEAFRAQLITAAQEMTRLRKEKIEFQRKRKELADEHFKLELERKIHLPANTPASPTDNQENQDADISMTGISDESNALPNTNADNSEDAPTKSKPRQLNKNKRKAAAMEAKKEKAQKAKAEAEKTKKQKEWEKLLSAIEDKKAELKECEDNIAELDDDLRETLVHRSKMLGKDRFLNKYYWFEHNGMPFGGVPNSSTAEYGYANGRIWVQGPDEHELQPNLEEPCLSQDQQRLGFTVPQRKLNEEGSTHLSTSSEWAYYDTPEEMDHLLQWLDERGLRERALRKELTAFRARIAEYMEKMNKHLSEANKTEEEEEEDSTIRVSTRRKAYVDQDADTDRCLRWTNSIMRDLEDHIHSDEYDPPRKAKASKYGKKSNPKGKR